MTTHTRNDAYQVEKNIKFVAAEAFRGVSSLNFDARGTRFANKLGTRDYVTGES